MSDLAIQVKGLSKRFRIGKQDRYPTIRESLMRAAAVPLRAIRFWAAAQNTASADWIWALRDLDLEVKQGEVLGIVGRNGAGKSTFLKVLSGITEPTAGHADIYGRIGSLLEVGTGFHMELTGRENIFMNGALLGMRRHEIRRKFDEIVGFAETEKFIDTPVKHYSSGMYLRLAFAVAAHLDPEILIVDEVLAVGDIQFQRKCLGKMQEVSKSLGRTVLFVSHNMDAIQRLCSKCLLLENGELAAHGETSAVLAEYVSNDGRKAIANEWIDVSGTHRTGTGEVRFVAVQYSSLNESVAFQACSSGPLEFRLAIVSDSSRTIESLAVSILDASGKRLVNADTVLIGRSIQLCTGRNLVRLRIDKLHLNPGGYGVALWLANPRTARSARSVYDYVEFAFEMDVVPAVSEQFKLSPSAAVTCDFNLVDVTWQDEAEQESRQAVEMRETGPRTAL